MKKIIAMCMVALMGLTVTTTTASADSVRGKKIYLKKLKSPCGFNGAKFAATKTQDEWGNAYDGGAATFEAAIKSVCPKVENWDENNNIDLFDFVYEYAKDSGNVPSC